MTMDYLQQILTRIAGLNPSWTVNPPYSCFLAANLSLNDLDFSITGTTIRGFTIILHIKRDTIMFEDYPWNMIIHITDAQGGIVCHGVYNEHFNPSEYRLLHELIFAAIQPQFVAQNLKNQAAKREFFETDPLSQKTNGLKP
jgi:hypothetical protein